MILLFSFDSHGAAQGEALSSTYHQCKNIYGNIFGNTISYRKKIKENSKQVRPGSPHNSLLGD